jgi:DNA polymerase-3 subunit epsilon
MDVSGSMELWPSLPERPLERPPERAAEYVPVPARAIPSDRLVTLSYAVVDVETTGGSPWLGHRVTEIAAVVVRDGQIAETFDTLVNPERSIPPFITRLTHITAAMVSDQPIFRDVSPRLLDLLRGHVFVGHNAAFDRRFVQAEVERAGGALPSGRTLCTVRLARRLLPHLRRRSLDHVAHHYGVMLGDRHRAMGDARATAHCLIRMLDDVGSLGLDTWADMQQLLGARRPRRGRPSAMPRGGMWEVGA